MLVPFVVRGVRGRISMLAPVIVRRRNEKPGLPATRRALASVFSSRRTVPTRPTRGLGTGRPSIPAGLPPAGVLVMAPGSPVTGTPCTWPLPPSITPARSIAPQHPAPTRQEPSPRPPRPPTLSSPPPAAPGNGPSGAVDSDSTAKRRPAGAQFQARTMNGTSIKKRRRPRTPSQENLGRLTDPSSGCSIPERASRPRSRATARLCSVRQYLPLPETTCRPAHGHRMGGIYGGVVPGLARSLGWAPPGVSAAWNGGGRWRGRIEGGAWGS